MEILKTLLLGVIQGLTEFLPVSSSGHLIIAQTFMGGGSEPETGSAMLLEVVLHVATGIAVLFVFRKDIIGIIRGCFSRDAVERKGSLTYSGLVILATIPAALAGILLNDRIDALFDTSKGNTAAYVASFMLFVTAGLLVLSSRKILLQNLCKLVLSALIGLLRHLCKLALSALTGLLRRFTRNDRYCERSEAIQKITITKKKCLHEICNSLSIKHGGINDIDTDDANVKDIGIGGGNLTALKALAIGVTQAVAIMPGISRSGSTIAVALIIGVAREEAGRFSFMLALPAIFGAALLQARHIDCWGALISAGIIAGFLASLVVGVAALKFLLTFIKKGKLHWFGYYCAAAAAASLTLLTFIKR